MKKVQLQVPVLVLLSFFPVLIYSQAFNFPHGGGNCTTDWDCSLGGVCINNQCECDIWFTGTNCIYLNLQRPLNFPGSWGFNYRSDNYYSWGGHCLENNGTYYGYFTFMCDHHSLADWTTVSSVISATASKPEGPYIFNDMIVQPWSTNGFITMDPISGLYLIFHIGNAQANASLWSPCFNNSNISNIQHNPVQSHNNNKSTSFVFPSSTNHPFTSSGTTGDGIFVSTSTSPNGPWTPYNSGNSLDFNLTNWWANGITNPTPFIFPNGTTLLAVAAFPCPANWGALAPNCIGLLRADHWSGPYVPLFDTPIVPHEGEDPFIFQDIHGYFHLLENRNTYHRACGAGVPCGGHAFSYDGLTWSPLFTGAFGPVITSINGTITTTAYVERPQIFQNATTGIPITFFTGMGVTSYYDSMSWAQPFCAEGMDPVKDCGPTIPPPPLLAQLVHVPSGLCLVTNSSSSFPCPGGWVTSCPVFLGDCSSPVAVWELPPGANISPPTQPFRIYSNTIEATGIAVDCYSCVPNTVAKAVEEQQALPSPVMFIPSGNNDGTGSFQVCTTNNNITMCLNGGDGIPIPPCKAGEYYLLHGQILLEECSSSNAQNIWKITPVT